MVRLNIKYSIEKDTETYADYIYEFNALEHGRINYNKELLEKLDPKLQSIISRARSKKEVYEKVFSYLRIKNNENPQLMQNSVKNLEDRWNCVGNQIIYFLEFLYNNPFPFEEVTVYLTTNNICPYSYKERYFFANYKYVSEQLDIIKHELNHFLFYYYYDSLAKKLGFEKYELLKESLTMFSNPTQTGKPNERSIREFFISTHWESLDEAINAGCRFLSQIN